MGLSLDVLLKYKGDIDTFIETGSYKGNGITEALKASFNTIISIENHMEFFTQCVEKFKQNLNVTIIYGDSKEKLPIVLKYLCKPAVFWLDSHTIRPSTEQRPVPLLKELSDISVHDIRSHVVMIDDVRMFGCTKHWERATEDMVLEYLKNINSKYKFIKEDCPNYKKDILVAYL